MPSTSTPTTSAAQSGGLSTGGKASLGVGVVVGVIALVALLFFVYWLGERHTPALHAAENSPTYGQVKAELRGDVEVNSSGRQPELYELDASSQKANVPLQEIP